MLHYVVVKEKSLQNGLQSDMQRGPKSAEQTH